MTSLYILLQKKKFEFQVLNTGHSLCSGGLSQCKISTFTEVNDLYTYSTH